MRWKILAILALGGALGPLALYPYTGAFAAELSAQSSQLITRSEAVYRLVEADPALRDRAVWFRSHLPPLPLFHDVPQHDALAPYLETAFEQGIITGNIERVFRPGDPLRVEEAIALIVRKSPSPLPLPAGRQALLVGRGNRNDWIDRVLQAALVQHIPLPTPIRIGMPITRQEFFSMLATPPATNFQFSIFNSQFSPVPISPTIPASPAGRPTVPTIPTLPLFSITMPTIGISDLPIHHPSDPLSEEGLREPLRRGVGHLFSFPGEGGNIFLYGHSSGYPWDLSPYTRAFREVNRLAIGDSLSVTHNGNVHTYRVTRKRTVAAEDLRPFQEEEEEERLLLYTCWPPDSTSQRYLVEAEAV